MAGAIDTGAGAGKSQEIDLNIAPILDAFVVLIAFMLVSAAYISIGILDAGISAPGTEVSKEPPPPINITVKLLPGNNISLNVTGKQQMNNRFKSAGGDWNFQALIASLTQLKQKYPKVNAITLTANNKVEYKEVVRAMEMTRKTVPVVLLGGF